MKLSALWPWGDDEGWETDDEDPEPLRCLIRVALVLVCLMLGGCSAPPAQPQSGEGPTILLWSEKTITMQQADQWANEAKLRVGSNPVVLVCHGGTMETTDRSGHKRSDWFVFPDAPRKPMRVDDVAWALRNEYWGRPLVVVACNAGGFDLTTPNTLYARRIVYCTPRRFSGDPMGVFRRADWVDSIWEFISTDGRVKLTGER